MFDEGVYIQEHSQGITIRILNVKNSKL